LERTLPDVGWTLVIQGLLFTTDTVIGIGFPPPVLRRTIEPSRGPGEPKRARNVRSSGIALRFGTAGRISSETGTSTGVLLPAPVMRIRALSVPTDWPSEIAATWSAPGVPAERGVTATHAGAAPPLPLSTCTVKFVATPPLVIFKFCGVGLSAPT